jgi:hypothetical protein
MVPSELKPDHFKGYPPLGRDLATRHLALLSRLPLVFLPILLREVIDYDWKFPAERNELDYQFAYLNSLKSDQLNAAMASFARLTPPSQFEKSDLVNQPGEFEQRLTAWLWSTRQMDDFQTAAQDYAAKLRNANPEHSPPLRRLSIVVLGQGVERSSYPLFRKLKPLGVHFTKVVAENGMALLRQTVAARAQSSPLSFGHWYVDGGPRFEGAWDGVTCISYAELEPMRSALLHRIRASIQSGGMGPETLRTMLLEMQPNELGATEPDPILSRFQVRILTEGSGTQIYSTSFAQWAAREALRRAQPITLLVRFAPRQRERSMDELLSNAHPGAAPETDPEGSLIDADMGGYYTWINQQRLSGANESAFLIWFEDHKEAVAIGPSMPRGTSSSSSMDLGQILALVS